MKDDNRFIIRHGASKPLPGDLMENELGFDTDAGILYIKNTKKDENETETIWAIGGQKISTNLTVDGTLTLAKNKNYGTQFPAEGKEGQIFFVVEQIKESE